LCFGDYRCGGIARLGNQECQSLALYPSKRFSANHHRILAASPTAWNDRCNRAKWGADM